MTIKNILEKYRGKLDSKELDQLLALALHKSIEYIYKYPEKKLNISSIKKFNQLVNKRLANYSLAYLQGFKEFYGLKFKVNKHTLIPRPESELIVEQVLEYIDKDNLNILDIGTGSGCLIVSIAKNNEYKAKYYASDISKKALQVARTNARKYKLKNIKFIQSDLLANLPKQKFDIILANLPYLSKEQMKETSISKEPKQALLGNLDYYAKLLKQLPGYLNNKYLILLEIDPSQKDKITEEIEKSLANTKLEFLKDLVGLDRLVKIFN